MASGRIATVDIPAGVNTVLYTMPVGRIQVLTVGVCNRNSSDVKIRLAFTDGATEPTDADYLEYDTTIQANGILERTGIALNGEQVLIGYSNTGNVSFTIWS